MEAATPLGQILVAVGCGARFKDWYFAEGGLEGPRKLQATKPLDARHACVGAERAARELLSFLQQPPRRREPEAASLEADGRHRAREVLQSLDVADPELRREIERTLADCQ